MFGRLLHAPPLAARAVGGAVAQARRVPRLRVLPGARRVPAVAARAALSTATVASARRGALVCPCTARRFATHAGNDGNSHNHKYVRLFKLPMSSTFADVTRFLSQAGVTPDPAHTAIITGATRAHGSWIIRVPARQQHAVLALHGSVVAGQAVDVRQSHESMFAKTMTNSSYLARRNTVSIDRLPHGTSPKQVRTFLENHGYPAARYEKFAVSSRVVHWGSDKFCIVSIQFPCRESALTAARDLHEQYFTATDEREHSRAPPSVITVRALCIV